MLGHVAEGATTLSDLATRSGLPKSTAHRLLSLLVRQGMLDVDQRSYRLGARLIELGELAKRDLQLARLARDAMESLSRRTLETVHLGILDGTDIIYLEKVNGARGLQMASYIGLRSPAQTTAMGKVLVAALPESQWREYFLDLPRRTEHTISTVEAFLDEIGSVRERGYGFDQEENEVGIRCLAAPIRDATGGVRAAVSVSGASVYISKKRLRELVPEVQACAEEISRQLGTPASA